MGQSKSAVEFPRRSIPSFTPELTAISECFGNGNFSRQTVNFFGCFFRLVVCHDLKLGLQNLAVLALATDFTVATVASGLLI